MSCKVSFIGLGVMGYPMAGYISKAGHNVTVYNRTKSKAEKWCQEYKGKIITKWNTKENFIVPKEADDDDITGTLQMKYAVELGGTIIHTVGFDCLKNRIEKDETWEWTKPGPWEMNKQQQRKWDQVLMDEWKSKMKTIEHKHLNIQWRHFV